VLEAEAPLLIEETVPTPVGERVVLAHKFALIGADGAPCAVASVGTDVTERTRQHVDVGRSADRLLALNESFLGFGPDPEENMRRLVLLSRDILGASFAMYQRAGRGMISSAGLWSDAGGTGDGSGGKLCDAVLLHPSDEVQVIRHLDETPYYRTDPNVAQFGLRTHLGRVVRLGDHVLGALCVAYRQDYEPTAEDRRLLGIVASALAVEERRLRAE